MKSKLEVLIKKLRAIEDGIGLKEKTDSNIITYIYIYAYQLTFWNSREQEQIGGI